MRYVLYVLAVLGGIALLAWLYSLVPEPTDEVPVNMVGVDSRQFDPLAVISAQALSPIATRNTVELLVNGEEIFPSMLTAIRAADESVEFLTYVYWTGEIARRFADELTAAADRGVRVRVLLDAFGARKMRDELVQRLRAAGCQVAWFHPFDWYHIKRFNHRTHRKVLVVDRRVGFTGGVGIAQEWTGDAQDPEHWRDSHFRVTGPVVRHMRAAFAENWRRATGDVLARPIVSDRLDGDGRARIAPLATSPLGRQSDIAVLYWLLLQRAERTVDISTPYFVPDESLVEAIAATARRGVRVRLLVPGPHLEKDIVRWASYATFDELVEAGVEVWEYQPTMMHSKTVVADNRWSIVGSANFDNRSIELNDELVLLIDDTTLAEQITAEYENDLSRSKRLSSRELSETPFYKQIAIWAGLLLREQL